MFSSTLPSAPHQICSPNGKRASKVLSGSSPLRSFPAGTARQALGFQHSRALSTAQSCWPQPRGLAPASCSPFRQRPRAILPPSLQPAPSSRCSGRPFSGDPCFSSPLAPTASLPEHPAAPPAHPVPTSLLPTPNLPFSTGCCLPAPPNPSSGVSSSRAMPIITKGNANHCCLPQLLSAPRMASKFLTWVTEPQVICFRPTHPCWRAGPLLPTAHTGLLLTPYPTSVLCVAVSSA